ncbi:unnamed protein product [Lasius platythorax]|uniref:CCHC-type domain-containing protein n=1 Tax=Lasius platythorax TaxID=488582 RepID=A0AAV2NM88_9HYME
MATESASGFSVTFTKLKGQENYINWKFQMKNYLRHDNLWNAISGYADEDRTSLEERNRRDEKALSKINLMVDQCYFSYLMKCETAKKAWDALENAFEDKGLNRRVGLLRSLCSVRLENFNSMEAYVNEVMSLSEKFRAVDKPVDDEFLEAIMLQGLPDTYQPMCMALEHSVAVITSDLVKTKLLQDTSWNRKNTQAAMFSYKQKKANFNSSNKFKPKKPFCWNCHEAGHHKSDCTKHVQNTKAKESSEKKSLDKSADKDKKHEKKTEKGLFSALSTNSSQENLNK